MRTGNECLKVFCAGRVLRLGEARDLHGSSSERRAQRNDPINVQAYESTRLPQSLT